MKYALLVREKYNLLNLRVHDLWQKMLRDDNVEKVTNDYYNYIQTHQQEDIMLIVYYYEHGDNFIGNLIDFIDKLD